MSNLKSRLKALEQNVPTQWLVLECKEQPADEQLNLLKEAYQKGQFAIIFVEAGNTIWRVGMPKPWESD